MQSKQKENCNEQDLLRQMKEEVSNKQKIINELQLKEVHNSVQIKNREEQIQHLQRRLERIFEFMKLATFLTIELISKT